MVAEQSRSRSSDWPTVLWPEIRLGTEVQPEFKGTGGDSLVFSTHLFQLQLPAHMGFPFPLLWVCSSSRRRYVSAQGQVGDAGTEERFCDSPPAPWLLSALFLGSTLLSTTHLCKQQAGCLQVVWKLPVQQHLGAFYCLPKTWEEKEPGSLVSGERVGWAGEDTWVLFAASCVLAGWIWDAYACVVFCIVSCIPPHWRAAIMPTLN